MRRVWALALVPAACAIAAPTAAAKGPSAVVFTFTSGPYRGVAVTEQGAGTLRNSVILAKRSNVALEDLVIAHEGAFCRPEPDDEVLVLASTAKPPPDQLNIQQQIQSENRSLADITSLTIR